MISFTARVVDPGMYYENRRNRQMVRVPLTHHAVVCGACAYAVHVPTRLGRDHAEQLRRDHLLTAHLSKVCTGAIVLTEAPPLFATAALTEPESASLPDGKVLISLPGSEERHMSLRGDANVPAGSVNGTVEHDEPRLVAEPLDSAIGLDGPSHSGRHFARTG